MEFRFRKRSNQELGPLVGPSIDRTELMAKFREELESLNIDGVDPRHLIGDDMEIWNDRKKASLSEADLQQHYETLKKDDMHIGNSRINFHAYLRKNPAYRR